MPSCLVAEEILYVLYFSFFQKYKVSMTLPNYAELAISSSCLQSTHECTCKYHLLALILKKLKNRILRQGFVPMISVQIYEIR